MLNPQSMGTYTESDNTLCRREPDHTKLAFICLISMNCNNNLFFITVTLFELMIVNNWWIIMEGFHVAVGDRRARIFFLMFHFTTIVSQHLMLQMYD